MSIRFQVNPVRVALTMPAFPPLPGVPFDDPDRVPPAPPSTTTCAWVTPAGGDQCWTLPVQVSKTVVWVVDRVTTPDAPSCAGTKEGLPMLAYE